MTSTDLTVRLRECGNGSAQDRFRFRISELSNRSNVLGEREVPVILVPERAAPNREPPRTPALPNLRPVTRAPVNTDEDIGGENQPNVYILIIGLVCLLGLCLPTHGDGSVSWVAQHATLTVNQKLIAAFVLGMVTMVVFRAR